jgi:hypothetical protein
MNTQAWRTALAVLFGLAAAAAVRAQEPKTTPPGTVRPAEPAAAPIGAVREKTVYVPYEKLDTVFEKEGRGIFLPYEEFLKLWQAAQAKPIEVKPDLPPAPAVLRGGVYAGEVAGDVARFTLALEIESLKTGWSELALPFKGVAMESVELSHPRALFSVVPVPGDGRITQYAVFLPEPGRYAAKLQFSARVVQEPGKKTVSFGIPPAAVSRLDFLVPETGARVEVQPSLAVTRTAAKEGATQVLAFLGNAREVSVSWMPPAGVAAGAGAVLSAEQSIRVHLGERILKVATDIDYHVLRGTADTLRVRLPEATRLIAVKGENIREWVPEGEDLVVRLHSALGEAGRATDGSQGRPPYRLSLTFERILPDTPPALAVPFPQAQDVLRESGWAALDHESGLAVRIAAARGLSQLDREEVPEAVRGQGPAPLFAFRYLAHPLALDLEIEKILPVVRSHTTSVIALGRDEDVWTGWIDYAIAKAGVFRFELRVPTRWSIASIGDGTAVEDFQTRDDGAVRAITVNLKSKALGNFRLPFRFTAPGSAAAGEATHGPPAVSGASEDRGLLGVSVPRAFEASTVERQKMASADLDELLRSGILTQVGADQGMPLAYSYREGPATVRLRVTARKTEVDLLAQHLLEIADGGIKLAHLLDFEVLYAATDRLTFTAPSTLDDRLKVEAKAKKEVRKVSTAGGRTLWEVVLQSPALGAVAVTVHHEEDLKALEAGRPFPYAVPVIHGNEVRSEKGFVALRKEGTLEITPQASGMEAIDASDLPDKLRRGQIYGAFRYFAADPSLTLTLTRYEYQPLATTIVNLIQLKTVLSDEGKLKTRATLFVQNTERQYLELNLPPEAILSLSVAGRAQQPRKRKEGAGTLVQIPASAGPAGTFPVVLVYEEAPAGGTLATAGGMELRTLEVLEKVPVGKVELELHLPPEYVYLGWSGSLKESAPGSPGLWSRFKGLLSAAVGKTDAVAVAQNAAAPPAATATPVAGAVDVDLPTRGMVARRFETLASVGGLRFFYVGRTTYTLLDFAAFLIAAAAAFIALKKLKWRPLHAAALLVFLPLALAWFTTPPASEVFTSILAGGLLAFAALGASALVARAHEWRASRLALEPDPYLEQADTRVMESAPKPEAPPDTPPEAS